MTIVPVRPKDAPVVRTALQDGDVLTVDGVAGVGRIAHADYRAQLLGGLSGALVYRGLVAGNAVPNTGTVGDYYLISSAGSSQGSNWQVGDIAIRKASGWDRIPFYRVVSVKDFGAVGDGVTDDTAAIQAAFNFAATLAAKGAGVLFPPGVYLISSTITVSRPVTVIGAGLTGDIASEYQVWSGTEIRYSGSGTAIRIYGDLNTNFCHRVFFRDFAVTSTGSGAIGIEFIRAEECDIINVRIGGTQSNGFSQYGLRGEHFSIVAIERCVIQGNGTGIFLDWDTGGCSQITIYKCNLYWNTNHVKLSGGSSINIEENQMERCHVGILIDNVNAQSKVQLDGIRIRDNHFNNSDGVHLGVPDLLNSRFLKVNATADVLYYLQRLSVTGNELSLDSLATAAVEFAVSTPANGGHFNLSITAALLAENWVRGSGLTAAVVSDVDFAPGLLWNDIGPTPLLVSGLHNRLNIDGRTAEAIFGATDAGSSLLRLLAAAGGGTTSNFLQAGRDSNDTQAVLTLCRTGSEIDLANKGMLAALAVYANQLQAKGSFNLDGILTLQPPGTGAIAYVIVNPQGGGSKLLQISAGTYNSPTDLTLAKIYATLLNVTGNIQASGMPSYGSNAAAVTGGLPVGAFYRNGDNVCIVH